MPEVAADHPFGPDNLPYGIFTTADQPDRPRIGVAIGDRVLDAGTLPGAPEVLQAPTLNPLLAAGRPMWTRVRRWLRDRVTAADGHLVPVAEVRMLLPFDVADYVDFYASEQHARNLGRILRPGTDPLPRNWKHLPIGYHGRAGTVVVSGTPVVRPAGQRSAGDFGPSRRLDIEAEVGFVVGRPGRSIRLDQFRDHVFGVCLVNDWSARDIQAWEYVPLGPFLGKSFATSISPWIVPLDALQAAAVQPPSRDVPLLPYLDDTDAEPGGLDIELSVHLNGSLISEPRFRDMYWTAAQLLAHLTVNGARVRTGDLFASGTVSGSGERTQGSLIELTAGGTDPLQLPGGSVRCFLEDGDTVTITATAAGPAGNRIGFGSVTGTVVRHTLGDRDAPSTDIPD